VGTIIGEIDLPSAFFTGLGAQESAPAHFLQMYEYYRTGFRVSAVVTASQFYLGRLGMAYVPGTNATQQITRWKETLVGARPFARIDAATSNAVEMDIPYRGVRQYMVKDGEDFGRLGKIYIFVINELKMATASSNSVRLMLNIAPIKPMYELYSSFVQPSLQNRDAVTIPRPKMARAESGCTSGAGQQTMQSAQQSPGIGGMISSALDVALPFLSLLDKPTQDRDPQNLQPRLTSNLAKQVEPVNVQNIYGANSSGFKNVQTDFMGEPLTFKELCTRPGLLDTTHIDTSTSAGIWLKSLPVTPTFCPRYIRTETSGVWNGQKEVGLASSWLAACAWGHLQWRGTIDLTVEVVCSGNHTCTLAIVWFPNVETTVPGNYADVAQSHVQEQFQVKGTQTKVKSIPFASRFETRLVLRPTDYVTDWPDAKRENSNGVIGIYLVNPLTAPSSVADQIAINYYFSSKDIEFWGVDPTWVAETTNFDSYDPNAIVARAESGMCEPSSVKRGGYTLTAPESHINVTLDMMVEENGVTCQVGYTKFRFRRGQQTGEWIDEPECEEGQITGLTRRSVGGNKIAFNFRASHAAISYLVNLTVPALSLRTARAESALTGSAQGVASERNAGDAAANTQTTDSVSFIHQVVQEDTPFYKRIGIKPKDRMERQFGEPANLLNECKFFQPLLKYAFTKNNAIDGPHYMIFVIPVTPSIVSLSNMNGPTSGENHPEAYWNSMLAIHAAKATYWRGAMRYRIRIAGQEHATIRAGLFPPRIQGLLPSGQVDHPTGTADLGYDNRLSMIWYNRVALTQANLSPTPADVDVMNFGRTWRALGAAGCAETNSMVNPSLSVEVPWATQLECFETTKMTTYDEANRSPTTQEDAMNGNLVVAIEWNHLDSAYMGFLVEIDFAGGDDFVLGYGSVPPTYRSIVPDGKSFTNYL
jgi:hypothetical protein